MEKILNSEETIEEKNKILAPLYNDIKLLIRKMTKTEEAEIVRDFSRNAARVITHGGDNTDELLQQLSEEYSDLIAITRKNKTDAQQLTQI